MKTAILYSSGTGNTEMLAKVIKEKYPSASYCGKVQDEAFDSDLIFVGFWTMKFTCGSDIKKFLEKLKGKRIFLFGTAGYDNTDEYFKSILDSVKENIDQSNEIVGEYMSMGKVSATKKQSIQELDAKKYKTMEDKLAIGQDHPNQEDCKKLARLLEKI